MLLSTRLPSKGMKKEYWEALELGRAALELGWEASELGWEALELGWEALEMGWEAPKVGGRILMILSIIFETRLLLCDPKCASPI